MLQPYHGAGVSIGALHLVGFMDFPISLQIIVVASMYDGRDHCQRISVGTFLNSKHNNWIDYPFMILAR